MLIPRKTKNDAYLLQYPTLRDCSTVHIARASRPSLPLCLHISSGRHSVLIEILTRISAAMTPSVLRDTVRKHGRLALGEFDAVDFGDVRLLMTRSVDQHCWSG